MDQTETEVKAFAKAATAIFEQLKSGQTMSPLLGLSQRSLETLYRKAHTLYTQGKFEEAAPLFALLVAADHLDRRFLNGAAACMHMQKRHADALKYYAFSSLQDLTDPEPGMRSAECHLALGDRVAARKSLVYALAQARGIAAHRELVSRIEAMLSFLDASTDQQQTSGEMS